MLPLVLLPLSISAETPLELGDHYYVRGEFALARIEYERALLRQDKSAPDADVRLSLALLRAGVARTAFESLHRTDFSSSYLRLYASLRAGALNQALLESQAIEKRSDFTKINKRGHSLEGLGSYCEK